MQQGQAQQETEPRAVRCEKTEKLLARVSESGISLWCKECKTEHSFLWTDLFKEKIPLLHKQE